jgi:sugar (pentulose or hexulose) kinase
MYYVGIDLGTSGCRLISIDQSENIVYQCKVSYAKTDVQTPRLWWQSLKQLFHRLPQNIAKQLTAISIDGTSGTLLLCDAEGKPSSEALMYNDTRATQQAAEIANLLPNNSGAHGVGSSLSKLLYLLKQQPVSTQSAHRYALHQADWIANRLLGQFGWSDENNCLKLGYDPVLRQWPDYLSKLNFPLQLLPKVIEVGQCFGTISAAMAKQFHLPTQTKIVAGTSDSIAAFIATGAKEIGDAVTSLGSTLTIKILTQKPIYAPEMGIYSHRLGNQWLVGGASNTGGAVLLAHFDPMRLDELSQQLNPKQLLNLNYYPLLKQGERFPIADPNKQAIISPRPEQDSQFLQALLEGIADIEAQAYQCLNHLGAASPKLIYTVGGGHRNAAWTILRADKLGIAIQTPPNNEAAYGVALLAKRARRKSCI